MSVCILCVAAPTRASFQSGIHIKDYAPCSISAFGLFAISEFNSMRSCALIAQAAITCQVCFAAARKSSLAASMVAGDLLTPAPLLLLVMELIKVLW